MICYSFDLKILMTTEMIENNKALRNRCYSDEALYNRVKYSQIFCICIYMKKDFAD